MRQLVEEGFPELKPFLQEGAEGAQLGFYKDLVKEFRDIEWSFYLPEEDNGREVPFFHATREEYLEEKRRVFAEVILNSLSHGYKSFVDVKSRFNVPGDLDGERPSEVDEYVAHLETVAESVIGKKFRDEIDYQQWLTESTRSEEAKVRLRRQRLLSVIEQVVAGEPVEGTAEPLGRYFSEVIEQIKATHREGKSNSEIFQAIVQEQAEFFDDEQEVHKQIAEMGSIKRYFLQHKVKLPG